MAQLNNITGALLIDATAAFLNGAGLGVGEDKNKVIPKTFKEKVNGRNEEVPYVSAQSWRRWIRNTTNEENNWQPSELKGIKESEKGSTTKIATELNPVDFPEDDLFGYMKSGSKDEESIQRTSPFKTSILKGIKNMRVLSTDEAFVHLKEGTPLPYSTRFYSTHLEGFFNLEYYRLGVFDNLGSHQELSKELVEKHSDKFDVTDLNNSKFKRYSLKNAENIRKSHASGLLKGLAFLRGGAKQSAFGSDVSPKVLILAGMESANPVFNNLFVGTGEKPILNIDAIKQIADDYKDKLATPIYIGIRTGYLQNEDEVKALGENFVIDSPIGIVNKFNEKYLTNE
ncbi:MAG: type I-B CRISPR-associated protein Cas7/Cst2/DevR [Spirosomaceae bacterium]|jgi:CRISPR-associated protein Cst2|nr:type I-B CRISPR-associated protein Cas7/Cst2/DevR [Spirosomataceae bacterium]